MENKWNLSHTRLMVAGGLLFSTVALRAVGRQAQPKSQVSGGATPSASILTVPVNGLKVEHASMADALLKLRSSDIGHVVVGFEQIPQREGETGGPITMTLTGATLGETVRRLCQTDPRYEYRVIEGHMINASLRGSMIEIFPKGALEDANDLLNMKVRHYRADKRNAGSIQAIEDIAQDAPELREFLYQKAKDWSMKTGVWPGSPGSSISSNMPPPPFVLELHNVTVRQILDAISLKSVQQFKEGKNYGPVGWEYDFVIKPDASTGLGGIPKWKAF